MTDETNGRGPEDLRGEAERIAADARAAFEENLDEASRYLKQQWSERPLTVAAAALGVGVVLGLLLGGRR